jgi:pimeloyl-ACP methyl ester carboxylesterase
MTTRRTLLASAAAAPILASPLGSLQKASAQDKRGTFVLVSGQWTGGFIWHLVTPLLRAAGHDVYPVTCTGLGDRVHLADAAIDLDTHITDVVNVIEFADLRHVTLVGHSLGGMIITGVAEVVPERLKQLVYFDAGVPTDGQNSYDVDFIVEETRLQAMSTEIAEGMAAGMPGFRPVTPGLVEWVQAMVTDPDEAEWFISRLVPHPQLANLQPVKLGNPDAAALPRAFILCTADKDLTADPQLNTVVLAAERARSDPNWRVLELDNNHAVPLNDPQGTADALMSLL